MPKIKVTNVRLLPETNGRENFKTMYAGPVTAVSSNSRKHNVQRVESFLQKSGVLTTSSHFTDQPNKTLHYHLCC